MSNISHKIQKNIDNIEVLKNKYLNGENLVSRIFFTV